MAPSTNTTNHKRVYSPSLATPPGRLLFPCIAAPDAVGQYADNKYKATLVLPKNDAAEQFILQVQSFATKHLPCAPDEFIMPIRDGALRSRPDPDHWYVAAKSKLRPKTVDANLQPIDPALFRAGAIVRLAVVASPFTLAQSLMERGRPTRRELHGVTLYLQAVQLIRPAPEAADGPRDPNEALGTFHDEPVPF